MRVVVVTNGVVTNIVEVAESWTPGSSQWQPAKGSTALLNDTAEVGDTYTNGEFHKPSPPEPVVVVPPVISDRQFFQQLAVTGLITEAEALAAVKTGDIPAALMNLVQALPADQQFAAEMLLSGAVSFVRTHNLTVFFGLMMGWTSQELDSLWIEASKL